MEETLQVKNLPKVWKALMIIEKKNLTGELRVQTETFGASIFVTSGNIVNLQSPDFTPQKVLDILHRMRVLSATAVAKAQKIAQKEKISPVQAAVQLGLVQEETVNRVQEFLLKEAILNLVMDETADASFVKELHGAIAQPFHMPIAFILKEATKRKKEWPHIKTKVPFMKAVFQRKPAVDPVTGEPYPWEDLPLEGIEKIVYFFLDGKRTVAEIAATAFLSEFDVARAIYSLLNKDLAVKVTYYQEESEAQRLKSRKFGLGIYIGYTVFFFLLVLVALGVSKNWLEHSGYAPGRSLEEIVAVQSEERVRAALEIFRVRNGEDPSEFSDLLSARLVLPIDKKAAMKVRTKEGGRFLYRPK